jgi:hypothetical protein
VKGGTTVEVPLWISVMTGADYTPALQVSYELSVSDAVGRTETIRSGSLRVPYTPWMQHELDPISVEIPDIPGIGVLKLTVSDPSGEVLHRNFMIYEIVTESGIPGYEVFSVPAAGYSDQHWSTRQWEVMDGLKVDGAGSGYFEYTFPLPGDLKAGSAGDAYFVIEVSAKEYFVKDREAYDSEQNFMLGSQVAPSANPNSYPMTDEVMFPSEITVSLMGEKVCTTLLPDDPADHRGILSWHHQLKDKKLREAGSYGYLVKVPVSGKILRSAVYEGALKVRIETTGEGGIAIYGKEFGRFALDPSLVLTK